MPTHPHLIYCKTEKGRLEVTDRQHGLSARQRSALIIIDCAKTMGIVANIIPQQELAQTIPFLSQHGFIVLADALREQQRRPANSAAHHPGTPTLVPVTPVVPVTAAKPGLTQDMTLVGKVKDFMITTANTHLGLMGADIIMRIQRCHNAEQLMAAAGFWHMALRESRTGSSFASTFIEQVKFELREQSESP